MSRAVERWWWAVLGVAAALAAACGDDGRGGSVRSVQPTIVATTSIWADVVANVTCDGLATVESLIPAGSDPHAFEPSLADRGRLDEAALVVANGLGLEEGIESTVEASEAAGTPVFRVGDHVEVIDYSGGGVDPHVWMDPIRVADALSPLADSIVAATGLDADAVGSCVKSYHGELVAIDGRIEESVAAIPESDRKLVTNHDSLGYFADRYGFEVVGTVIPAPSGLAQTNPAQLEELAEVVDQTGVGVIFADSGHSADDAEAVAARVAGVEVVPLPSGTLGEVGSGAETYLGLVRTTSGRVTTALR